MEKYLTALLLVPTMASSQEFREIPMPVLCGETTAITSVLMKYDEILLWSNTERDGVIVTLWQNMITNSFTLIKTEKTGKISCVISAGGTPQVAL